MTFAHRFSAGEGVTLLLLHGTGGDEHDLLPVGEILAPGTHLLSPRGRVLENGMSRFFRRYGEGRADFADVRRRAEELAAFVDQAAREYHLDPARVVAAGYSNGAAMAAALLLLYPGVLAGAVLFRASVPVPAEHAGARGPAPLSVPVPVFLANGLRDTQAPPEEAGRLAELLRQDCALVTLEWHAGGHELTRPGVESARAWLAAQGF